MSSQPDVDRPRNSLNLLEGLLDDVLADALKLLDHLQVRFNDINRRNDSVFVVGWNKWRWAAPLDGAQPLIGQAREDWAVLDALAEQAIRLSAPERTDTLKTARALLRRIIEQDDKKGAPGTGIEDIGQRVTKALEDLRATLRDLPSAHGAGGQLLVPDTNALLYRPNLEQWAPPPGDWTVVLVPQVLRELDQLKMRPNQLGEKAGGIIRRVKEYGRRGDTFRGVPLAGRLQLREVAVDADMTDTLNWLRPGHADDELLASTLELRCRDLQAVVSLATRDRNLQNKARLARCPYLDVEDDL